MKAKIDDFNEHGERVAAWLAAENQPNVYKRYMSIRRRFPMPKSEKRRVQKGRERRRPTDFEKSLWVEARRWQVCARKIRFPNAGRAHGFRLDRHGNDRTMTIYKCEFCDGYHLAKRKGFKKTSPIYDASRRSGRTART